MFAIILVFFLNYIVALVTLFLSLLIVINPLLFKNKVNKEYKDISDSFINYSNHISNTLNGFNLIKSSKAINRITNLLDKYNINIKYKQDKYWLTNRINSGISNLLLVILELVTLTISGLLYYFDKAPLALAISFYN